MPSLNRTFLIGNLTRDPQAKHLPSGVTLAEFGMAVNRKWKTAQGEEREDVLFIDCAAFGKLADLCTKWLQKGRSVFVEGRLKYDSWDDKNGGGKRSKISMVVESLQFLGNKPDGEIDRSTDQRRGNDAPAPDEIPAEDIPF